MKELMDQLMAYIRGIWRYRWYAMMLAWALVLAGWFVVAKLPDQYEASARIYVDTDSILRPLMRGLAVQTNLNQRVQIMTRTLLSRPNLEKVTRMTDLDITARTPDDLDRLVQRLGSEIQLKSAGRRTENLYEISYPDSDPQRAKRVVQALLTIFVESTLGQSRQDSNSAQKFLDQQLREYEARLVESEERLKEFKRKHVGMMPGDDKDYFERLQGAEAELAQAKLQLHEEQRRRDEIQSQLKGEEPVFGFGPNGAGSPPATDLDGRISKLEQNLDALKLRYTDQHPDVISTKETIAELKAKRKEEREMLSSQPGAASPLDTNPVYQQMKISLADADGRIASLTVRVQEYEKRVAALREMIDTIPEVETELKRLNRDYSVTKQNYEALLSRRRVGADGGRRRTDRRQCAIPGGGSAACAAESIRAKPIIVEHGRTVRRIGGRSRPRTLVVAALAGCLRSESAARYHRLPGFRCRFANLDSGSTTQAAPGSDRFRDGRRDLASGI